MSRPPAATAPTAVPSTPWKTISHAMQQNLKAGRRRHRPAGTYNEADRRSTKGGSAAGDITLQVRGPGRGADPTAAGRLNASTSDATTSTIDGFDIGGAHRRRHRGERRPPHHDPQQHRPRQRQVGHPVQLVRVHHHRGQRDLRQRHAGLVLGHLDLRDPQHHRRHHDRPATGPSSRNNISHDNVHAGPATTPTATASSSMTSRARRPAGYPNYTYPTLVDGNVVYDNGGKGIAVHWSDNVTVSNNTAYHNNQDNENTGTWRGEFSNQDSRNNTWVNNIAVADTERELEQHRDRLLRQQQQTRSGSTTSPSTARPGQASIKRRGRQQRDPRRRRQQARRQPAVRRSRERRLPPEGRLAGDRRGHRRLRPRAHRRRRQRPRRSGPSTSAPTSHGSGGGGDAPTPRRSPGRTAASRRGPGVALTIDDAALLANDTDANGDTLSISAVGSASNGTVRLNAERRRRLHPDDRPHRRPRASATRLRRQGRHRHATVSLTVTAAGTVNTAPTISTAPRSRSTRTRRR